MSEKIYNCLVSDIRTNVEDAKQMEKDLTEERYRYQALLSEHLHLEERHRDAEEEMNLCNVRNTLSVWFNHMVVFISWRPYQNLLNQEVQSFM